MLACTQAPVPPVAPLRMSVCALCASVGPPRTLTKPVGFEECIVAIKENAFVASEYPSSSTPASRTTCPPTCRPRQQRSGVWPQTLSPPRQNLAWLWSLMPYAVA